MEDFSPRELRTLRALQTPKKIQDFLDTIPINFDDGEYLSPKRVLQEWKAQCMEGAMLACVALRMAGHRPLVLDLRTVPHVDQDHVVALFQKDGCWGAISKTNHGILRYREPIYKTIRELTMSYFHEYFLDNGRKTLRSYAGPIDLSRFDKRCWMTTDKDLRYIALYLDSVRHSPLLTRSQISSLRRADPIERKMGKMVEWEKT